MRTRIQTAKTSSAGDSSSKPKNDASMSNVRFTKLDRVEMKNAG